MNEKILQKYLHLVSIYLEAKCNNYNFLINFNCTGEIYLKLQNDFLKKIFDQNRFNKNLFLNYSNLKNQNEENNIKYILNFLEKNHNDNSTCDEYKILCINDLHSLKENFVKNLIEKLQSSSVKYIFFGFTNNLYNFPKYLKNLFFLVNFNSIDAKKNIIFNCANNFEDENFFEKKKIIFEMILKKASDLIKKNQLNNSSKILDSIEKIEKIFSENENFHLNKNFVLEYINILLENFE